MFAFLKKLFGIHSKEASEVSAFEQTFSYLKELGEGILPQAGKVYSELGKLSKKSTEKEVDTIILELQQLRYASNTNAVFFFYLPIVSHILYFRPEQAKEILHFLVGPLFANGDEEKDVIIRRIQGSMNFKFKDNPNYLTKEGQSWVEHTLPTLGQEVQQELDICEKELED